MSEAIAAGRRLFPRGYAHFGLQLAIWFGFLGAYQVARGVADRDAAEAFQNGRWVIDAERSITGLFEISLQGLLDSSELLIRAASWTYWLSQFAVVGLALLWTYFRRNDAFIAFRNTILLANLLGLVGYVLLPTAPPRMFPEFGFADTLAQFASLNHGSGIIELASNPYAAMPSLHAADSLIVGIAMAFLVRRTWAKALWVAWPLWVWFVVMATGNHFWLDIAAGVLVALLAAVVVLRPRLRALRWA
jgi:membrane-associated phospholipid phosphatase